MHLSSKLVVYLALQAATLLVARESRVCPRSSGGITWSDGHPRFGSGGTEQHAPVLRLAGAGRAWIRKKVKAAVKKERQRKKRNIENTNLRASVRPDPKAINKHALLQIHMEEKALEWIRGGRNHSDMPVVDPVKFFESLELAQNQSSLAVEGGEGKATMTIEQAKEEKRARTNSLLEDGEPKKHKKPKLSSPSPDAMALRGGRGQKRGGGGQKRGGRGRGRGASSKPPLRGMSGSNVAEQEGSQGRQGMPSSAYERSDENQPTSALEDHIEAGGRRNVGERVGMASASAAYTSSKTQQELLGREVEAPGLRELPEKTKEATLGKPPVPDPSLIRPPQPSRRAEPSMGAEPSSSSSLSESSSEVSDSSASAGAAHGKNAPPASQVTDLGGAGIQSAQALRKEVEAPGLRELPEKTKEEAEEKTQEQGKEATLGQPPVPDSQPSRRAEPSMGAEPSSSSSLSESSSEVSDSSASAGAAHGKNAPPASQVTDLGGAGIQSAQALRKEVEAPGLRELPEKTKEEAEEKTQEQGKEATLGQPPVPDSQPSRRAEPSMGAEPSSSSSLSESSSEVSDSSASAGAAHGKNAPPASQVTDLGGAGIQSAQALRKEVEAPGLRELPEKTKEEAEEKTQEQGKEATLGKPPVADSQPSRRAEPSMGAEPSSSSSLSESSSEVSDSSASAGAAHGKNVPPASQVTDLGGAGIQSAQALRKEVEAPGLRELPEKTKEEAEEKTQEQGKEATLGKPPVADSQPSRRAEPSMGAEPSSSSSLSESSSEVSDSSASVGTTPAAAVRKGEKSGEAPPVKPLNPPSATAVEIKTDEAEQRGRSTAPKTMGSQMKKVPVVGPTSILETVRKLKTTMTGEGLRCPPLSLRTTIRNQARKLHRIICIEWYLYAVILSILICCKVTTGKRACAAFGFFFDIEASENHSVCIQQILTASYILANRTLKISAWCTPGPDNYGPIPLARPITIAKGSKMGFCIHTDHPWGIVLRALVPASADFPETLEGSGMHKINLGDVTDSNLHVKLRAGRVLSNPLSTPFQYDLPAIPFPSDRSFCASITPPSLRFVCQAEEGYGDGCIWPLRYHRVQAPACLSDLRPELSDHRWMGNL
ncbi:hypothetical protein GUITHDRAFT_131609 [Guillardia theta CCMP2712]|uniref:Uncharacterized protein n=1 Tax=Guillardia theta (strain CCMP2712) TaxID=905079 RepID=L1K480_GUITC|nr:hypothetical protein GUITHDRAFT_131609 [Guillardia theta CCMP2712]EKX55404.1 hypothetical protein GUITHDRAFT_131609 [Guillardia theta CCMP2712]|eukprot:XP_005842384.1 hypothetical protein GUITHDRAFT_131609 [Guillardia theta CCMP2712]